MQNLKRCPFCGGRDVRVMQLSTTFRFFCACNSCHATTGEYVFKEEAIKAWNNRPSPWHTGKPTEEGWYLFQFEDRTGFWFRMEYLDLDAIERLTEKNLLDDAVWQKIEEKT